MKGKMLVLLERGVSQEEEKLIPSDLKEKRFLFRNFIYLFNLFIVSKCECDDFLIMSATSYVMKGWVAVVTTPHGWLHHECPPKAQTARLWPRISPEFKTGDRVLLLIFQCLCLYVRISVLLRY